MNRRKIFIILLFTVAIVVPSAIILKNLKNTSILTSPVSDIFLSNKAQSDGNHRVDGDKQTPNDTASPNTQDSSKNNSAQTQVPSKTDSQKNSAQSVKPFSEIVGEMNIKNFSDELEILIDKSDHTLSLTWNGATLKSYHVEFGDGGTLDKEIKGDRKTPEGTFFVANKSVMNPPDYYLGSRWLGVGYPNIEDAQRGLKEGLIDKDTYDEIASALKNGDMPTGDTALGGDIGIHGGSIPEFGSNWTWGCIGLSNKDIEDFYDFIPEGTPIVIQK